MLIWRVVCRNSWINHLGPITISVGKKINKSVYDLLDLRPLIYQEKFCSIIPTYRIKTQIVWWAEWTSMWSCVSVSQRRLCLHSPVGFLGTFCASLCLPGVKQTLAMFLRARLWCHRCVSIGEWHLDTYVQYVISDLRNIEPRCGAPMKVRNLTCDCWYFLTIMSFIQSNFQHLIN